MADIKTKPTSISPRTFINQVESEQRRKDCRELAALMQDVTGHPPKMWGPSIVGFGHYRCTYANGREAQMLLTGFSPRKQDLVLYLGPGLHEKGLTGKLGKHKTGKGCLYLNTLDDVDRGVLRTLIETSVSAMRRQHAKD